MYRTRLACVFSLQLLQIPPTSICTSAVISPTRVSWLIQVKHLQSESRLEHLSHLPSRGDTRRPQRSSGLPCSWLILQTRFGIVFAMKQCWKHGIYIPFSRQVSVAEKRGSPSRRAKFFWCRSHRFSSPVCLRWDESRRRTFFIKHTSGSWEHGCICADVSVAYLVNLWVRRLQIFCLFPPI